MRGADEPAIGGMASEVTQRPAPSDAAMPALGTGLLGARIVSAARVAASLHMGARASVAATDQASRLRALVREASSAGAWGTA